MVTDMKSKVASIKSIFLNRMLYSAAIQFLVLALIIILVKGYLYHNRLNEITDKLIIKDSFTVDAIGNYKFLGNQYALDLELSNLSNDRGLDSIEFSSNLNKVKSMECSKLKNGFQLCKTEQGNYSGVSPIKIDNKIIGYIITHKKYILAFASPLSYWLISLSLVILAVFLFNFIFLFISMKRKLESNTKLLIDFISDEFNSGLIPQGVTINEYVMIANKFIEKKAAMEELQKDKAYYEARKNIAEQVAHDIRSPLAAINTALSNVSAIPENRRIMIKNASSRINDIANNLLSQFKNNSDNSTQEEPLPELMFVALDSIVSEKRYEHDKIQIELNIANDATSCFSLIHLASFKRVLSNLINNSIEAITTAGIVNIHLYCDTNSIIITIEDNGCGIPDHILPKITQQGFSYQKDSGAGFGLSYAKNHIEQVNGKLQIESIVAAGTKITISLPRCETPQWFCDEIQLLNTSNIVILDDDSSIHEAWRERLSHLSTVNILDFSDVSSFIQQSIHKTNSSLYLIDYELLGNEKNGLDIIAALGLEKRAILVTSNFENHEIRERCIKLGIKIIPKPFVPFIPISLKDVTSQDHATIFIDDDEMMRMTWLFAAENAGKPFFAFSSPAEFNKQITEFDKNSVVYIDSNLENDQKGELYAKELHDIGFTEIHLSTGYEHNKFENMPWIKSVVGKEPPFPT